MSEALGASGPRGTEELSTILNGHFETTISVIESYGGLVGKFGGDALTALFPVRGKHARGTTRRAVQCALELQASEHFAREVDTIAGQFTLSARAGLALGPVLTATVGDPAVRLEYVIAGSVLDRASAAERQARPGEVVLAPEILTAAGDVRVAAWRAELAVARRLEGRVQRAPLAGLSLGSDDGLAAAAPFLHPSLVERLKAGHRELTSEHRRVTMLFGRFPDLDYDRDPDAVHRLQGFAKRLIRVLSSFDGHLRQLHMGDKGSAFVVAFGAPIAHEDDEERAILCALELRRLGDMRCAIGINTGKVFAGFVGSQTRQEYAVIGEAVNVAARLMERAPLEAALVGESTRARVALPLAWGNPRRLRLKGKSDAMVAFCIRAAAPPFARLNEPPRRRRLLGRTDELRRIGAAARRALWGNGQVVAISGEPGIGKSRLVGEMADIAGTLGFELHAGTCEAFGTPAPYHPWRSIWRGLLGLADEARNGYEARLAALVERIEPGAGERAPLLGPILGLRLNENDLTSRLEPAVRSESALALLLSVLRHCSGKGPLLVVLEDCHWIDERSAELTELVARNIADLPVLLLLTYRGLPRTLAQLPRLPNTLEVPLGPLEPSLLETLARDTLTDLDAPDGLMTAPMTERLAEASGGNPFYVEELARYVEARGPQALSGEVPESLQSLVMARIDELPEHEKAILRVASVIGRSFRARWVWSSYPVLGPAKEVEASLEELSRLDLTPRARTEPELEYVFKHATTREVAYASLSYAAREGLHDSIAGFIERAYGEGPEFLDAIAHHYGASANVPKQRIYFRRAGDAARTAFANEAAIDYYARLTSLVPDEERSEVMCESAGVLQLVGRWDEAHQLLREAMQRAEAGGSRAALARGQAGLGHLLSHSGSYAEAIVWLERAKSVLERIGPSPELRRVLEHLSLAHFWNSDYRKARLAAQAQLELAEALGDDVGRCLATETLGLVDWHEGLRAAARARLVDALGLARETGNRQGVIAAANDLAGLLSEEGAQREAFECLQEAYLAAIEIGYRRAAGIVLANIGELSRRRGEHEGALACYAQALEISAELGDSRGLANRLGNIGLVCSRFGGASDATRLLEAGVAIARETKDAWNLAFFLVQLAVLREHSSLERAKKHAVEGLELARAAGFREVELEAELLLARLSPDARRQLEILRADARDEAERARVLYELWALERSHEWRSEAADLQRRVYDATKNADVRLRFESITGQRLPDPPPLPALPDGVAPVRDIDEVVATADRIILARAVG